jgi:hypothetical protein
LRPAQAGLGSGSSRTTADFASPVRIASLFGWSRLVTHNRADLVEPDRQSTLIRARALVSRPGMTAAVPNRGQPAMRHPADTRLCNVTKSWSEFWN